MKRRHSPKHSRRAGGRTHRLASAERGSESETSMATAIRTERTEPTEAPDASVTIDESLVMEFEVRQGIAVALGKYGDIDERTICYSVSAHGRRAPNEDEEPEVYLEIWLSDPLVADSMESTEARRRGEREISIGIPQRAWPVFIAMLRDVGNAAFAELARSFEREPVAVAGLRQMR